MFINITLWRKTCFPLWTQFSIAHPWAFTPKGLGGTSASGWVFVNEGYRWWGQSGGRGFHQGRNRMLEGSESERIFWAPGVSEKKILAPHFEVWMTKSKMIALIIKRIFQACGTTKRKKSWRVKLRWLSITCLNGGAVTGFTWKGF